MLDQTALPQTVHRDPSVSAPASNAPLASAAPEWPEPDLCLLDDWRGHLPAFPLDVLPKAWRPWASRAANGANASVDHVALSLIAVAAGQIGHIRRIAPVPSWSEPCILWTALVGPPSSGKTPAMDTALHMVRAMERRHAIAHYEACRRHEETIQEKKERAKEELRRALRDNTRLPDFVPEPDPPPPRPLTASDATIEAMAEALRNSARGVLLPRDQRSDWLDRMRDDSERAFWLSAWSGHPFLVERKGKPAFNLPCPGIAILGTIEPDMMASALAAGDDRVIARFLFAWAERPSFQSLSEMAEAARPEERQALTRLYDMPEARRIVPLEAEAVSSFDGFRRMHDAEAGKFDGRDAAWWGKGPGTVLRLAGTLTFLAWAIQPQGTAEPAQVPAWTIKAAARLWRDYLWPHARAVFRTAGSSPRDSQSQKILRWIRRERRTEVSRTELRRDALGRTCNAAAAERVAEQLVSAGWLKPVHAERDGRGRPPSRWAVNPVLQEVTGA